MHFSNLLAFSALATSLASCHAPWQVRNFNINHVPGTMIGVWSFDVNDDSPAPYGFKTKCTYWSTEAQHFAIDGNPVNAPCDDKTVTFTFEQPLLRQDFVLTVMHTWGSCATPRDLGCMDMGFWSFSDDDVLGQQIDNNGDSTAANFERASMTVYPNRFISAGRAKELIEGTEGQDVDAGETGAV